MTGLTGNEILYVLGVQANGKPAAITEQTTTGAIAALASAEYSGNTVTNITTVGNGTLTAAALAGGVINRSGPTADYTDTTATAAQLYSQTGSDVNVTFYTEIKNTVPFLQTLTGGTGITFSGQTIIPANSVGTYLVTFTNATAAVFRHVQTVPLTTNALEVITSLSTVGAGTITAVGIAGAVTSRSGPIAVFTDTTDTATNIIAAMPNAHVGQSFEYTYINTTAFTATLTGGTGVTVSVNTLVPANSWARYLVTYTAAATITIAGIASGTRIETLTLVNTVISTVGAGTLTAAGMTGGLITRSGSVAAYTDTTDTAANIISALPNAAIGQSFEFQIKNTVPFTETLAGGTGVTLSGQTIIPGNSVGTFLVTYTAANTATMVGISVVPLTSEPLEIITALTTVGAGTITAAGIAGGITNRTGSTAAFTDTTDTATNIIAALPNANVGQSFEYTYFNNTAGTATLTGGTGVTVSGLGTLVPQGTWARFLVTYTAAATVTMVAFSTGSIGALPASKFTTGTTTTTFAAAQLTGANYVIYTNTQGTPGSIATRTATQMIADIPNAYVGQNWILRVVNGQGTGTLTITAGTDVTLTGTATVAINTWRDFNCSITSVAAHTITMQNIGDGTFS